MTEAQLTRFMAKVQMTDGCWLWQGSRTPKGYGTFTLAKGACRYAHRLAYEQFVGLIPGGLQIDHLCRVRNCVNPKHLEPVTSAENQQRGKKGRLKTHCAHGHEYMPANVGWRKRSTGGDRYCRTCENERNRRYRAAKRVSLLSEGGVGG